MKIPISFWFYFLFIKLSFANITVCSWNIENFGKTKSASEIDFIATATRDYDIIAIQEVVAGDGGAQAVAQLNDALNRTGSKWDYSLSNPTSSSSYKTERYAFLWKTSKVSKIGDSWLEKQYNLEIDREPFFTTFKAEGKVFTLVTFHAITKADQPETEIKYFKLLPPEYPDLDLIFCGDFNLPQSHTVFNPLKEMGYAPIFTGQKTTLRQECINNDCLASEYDNMFYNTSKITLIKSAVILFYMAFYTIPEARKVSDHCPIYFEFSVN